MMFRRWTGLLAFVTVFVLIDSIPAALTQQETTHPPAESRSAAVITSVNSPTDEPLYAVAWNPSNGTALLAGNNGTVLAYDPGAGFSDLSQDNNFTFHYIAFRPLNTSTLALLAGEDLTNAPAQASVLLVYDGSSFTRLDTSGYKEIKGVAWSPDASYALLAVTAGINGAILKYQGGSLTEVYGDASRNYKAMCWGDGGAYLASYNYDNSSLNIQLFDGSSLMTDIAGPSLDMYARDLAWSVPLKAGLCTAESANLLTFNSIQAASVQDSSLKGDLQGVAWAQAKVEALITGADLSSPEGQDGLLYSYNGSALTLESSGKYSALNDVAWHPSDRYAIVVGDSGTVLRYTPANTRPLCLITTPHYPPEVVAGNIQVAGNASDPDGDKIVSVQVEIDAGAWYTATGGESWTYDWDTTTVTNGQHTIYARSSDGIEYSISDAREVILSNPNRAPSVGITTPTEGATISGTVTVTGTASDPDAGQTVQSVFVAIDGGPWQNAAGTSNWTFYWNTNTVNDGQHTIAARASDGELNSSDATVSVTVQNLGPNSPPTCAITAPASGTTVTGNVLIQGTAADADNGVQAVFVRIDSGGWQQASDNTSWSFLWDTGPVSGGSHLVSAHSYDGLVNSSEVHVDVVVNHPPDCAITSPAAGAALSGVVTVTGTASDPDPGQTVTAVSVRFDGGDWSAATGTVTWSYKWNTTAVGAGAHTIHARSSDGSLDSVEATRSVTVQKPPNAVTLSDPASVGEDWVVLVWSLNTDTGFARYEVYLSEQEGQPLSELTPRNIPTQSVTIYNYTGLQPRTTYWFRVVVSDASGLTAVSNEVYSTTERENQPPVAMLIASRARSDVGGSITFSADGSYDPDQGGRIARYQWDFDGSGLFTLDSGLISTQRHEFNRAGRYVVSVKVTDDRGASSVASVNVTITEPQKTGQDPLLMVGLIVSIAAAGIVVYLIDRRRRPQEPTPEERIHDAAARRREEYWPGEEKPTRPKRRKG